jgi:hypothetical protein
MFTVGNQQRETRQLPPIAAERRNCTHFQLKCVLCQPICSQYPRPCPKFPRLSFLLEYIGTVAEQAVAPAGLAIRRHLMQKRPHQIGRLMRA